MASNDSDSVIQAVEWWMKNMNCAVSNMMRSGTIPQTGISPMLILSMMTETQLHTDKNNEKIEKFREILESKIRNELYIKKECLLRVDYDPEGILADALKEAGIQSRIGMFPTKTIMWVYPDRIEFN